MGGMLTFAVGEVRRLVAHSKAAAGHRPTYADIHEPAYHKGGAIKMGEGDWPDSENVDRALVPAALHLVADQGVYLMSNGLPGLLVEGGATRNVVAYARESDPNSGDEDWYEAKRSIMGGDDEVTALPVEMFEQALAMLDDNGTLSIKVTPDHIEVVLP